MVIDLHCNWGYDWYMAYEAHVIELEPEVFYPLDAVEAGDSLLDLVGYDASSASESTYAVYDTGVLNMYGALSFAEQTGELGLAYSGSFDPNSFSVMLWFNASEGGSVRNAVALGAAIRVTVETDETQARVILRYGTDSYIAGPWLSVDEWHGLILVKNGPAATWHLGDGNTVPIGVQSGSWSDTPDMAPVLIQSLGLFGRALSEGEISEIYSYALTGRPAPYSARAGEVGVHPAQPRMLQTDWQVVSS